MPRNTSIGGVEIAQAPNGTKRMNLPLPNTAQPPFWRPVHSLIIVVGNYGSGKTEVAVNLALWLAGQGLRVRLADLDVVNLYFRSREAQACLEAHQVEVVVPQGPMRYADAPVILPQVRGMISDPQVDCAIFDVGGNDVGATVLSSLHDVLAGTPAHVLQVINARRPFTSTVDECLQMMDSIEKSGRVRVTELVSNTHLLDDTDVSHVAEGVRLTAAVAQARALPLAFVTVPAALSTCADVLALPHPVMPLTRRLPAPWAPATTGGQ